MKKRSPNSGLFHLRVLVAVALCSAGMLLAMFNFSGTASSVSESASAPSTTGPTTNLSNGITFDHAVWNDPIRMVGEPDIVIDNANGIYVSGPGGSTTQASWFWKSTDKGLQWHLIGCPLKSNCQNGGGDTEIAVANNRDVYASDLQTLTCNSALRSYDEGATWLPSEGCFPGTDRQWMGVYDPNNGPEGRRVYLSANGQANGCYFLVSTDDPTTPTREDGAIFLPPAGGTSTGSIGGSCIGRFVINPANGHIYVPGSANTKVSTDGGVTWLSRPRPAQVADNLFSTIVLDTAGNLWQAWINNQNTKAFISYSTDEGQHWSNSVQVSTGAGNPPAGTTPDLHAVIMPWLVAGDPGRVAVVYYGTTNAGTTSVGPGDVNAVWYVYASISTNAMAANPTWTQVQAEEHAMHRSTICTGGTGCVESQTNGDRSLADFFAVDKDTDGRIYIAYNENSDLSLVVPALNEYIGKPINAAIRLRTGPSLFAAKGNLLPDPAPANVAVTSVTGTGPYTVSGTQGLPPGNWASDPAGDALYPVVPVASANHPALDILEASVGDDGTNLTVKMKMADLSAAALADAATTGGNPSWMATWFQSKGGVGPAGVTSGAPYSHKYVKWLGQNVFEYGTVSSVNSAALGAPTPKTLTYVPDGVATGSVVGNQVTITAPLTGFGLVVGDKIDQILTYAMVEHADITLNDWADQAKSFSYIIGTPASKQHLSDGYVEVSGDNFATSTLATLSNANNTWTASVASAPSGTICARQVLARDLYTSVWDDVQAGPVSCLSVGPVLNGVVSRKTHGNIALPGDLPLTMSGAATIECRSGGILTGNHTLVFQFANPLQAVSSITATATTSGGTQAVSAIGAIAGNLYTVNLTSVPNASHLNVTLNSVIDSFNAAGNVSAHMDVLFGDVSASGRTDAGDVTQVRNRTVTIPDTTNPASFRYDVNASGRIDAGDVTATRNATVTVLPP